MGGLKCNVMVTGPPKTGAETARRQYGSMYYGSVSYCWEFQGNMLGRPKDMKTAKHAETG